MDIEQTLKERQVTHGDFALNASYAQEIKRIFKRRYHELTAVQREALEMIATKIARILSGGADHIDNWHDISGYATLVEKELQRNHNYLKGVVKLDE